MSSLKKIRALVITLAFSGAAKESEPSSSPEIAIYDGLKPRIQSKQEEAPITPALPRDPATMVWAGLVSIFKKLPAGRKDDEDALSTAFQEYIFLKGGLTPQMYMRMSSLAMELGISTSDIDAVLSEQPEYPGMLLAAKPNVRTAPHLH